MIDDLIVFAEEPGPSHANPSVSTESTCRDRCCVRYRRRARGSNYETSSARSTPTEQSQSSSSNSRDASSSSQPEEAVRRNSAGFRETGGLRPKRKGKRVCYHSPYYESYSDESSTTDEMPKARRVKRKDNGKRKERCKRLSSDSSHSGKSLRKRSSSDEPSSGKEGTEEKSKGKRARKEKVKGKGTRTTSSRKSTISADDPSSEEQPRKRLRKGVRSSPERKNTARATELGPSSSFERSSRK